MWAHTAAAVQDFVVFGNVGPLSTYGENYVVWSGFNNPTLWAVDESTQAGFQPLSGDGGKIQRIIGGSDGYIFRENSISRMSYVGPPIIFSFDEFGINRGTSAPRSVVRLDNRIFYYDDAGFYMVDTRTGEFTPIGHQKVDEWFKRTVSSADCRNSLQATIDPDNNLVLWAFCTNEGDATNTHILAYDYEIGRWSLLGIATELVTLLPTTGLTLDELDAELPGGIDANSITVDSQLFTGGIFALSLFDADHKLGTFGGDPLAASIATAEMAAPNDNYIRFNNVRLHADVRPATAVAATAETRDNLNLVATPSPVIRMGNNGDMQMRGRSRYVRFIVDIMGGFSHATGLEVFGKIK